MKKSLRYLFAVTLIAGSALSLQAKTYYRSELLDQGRRFTSTLNQYIALGDPKLDFYMDAGGLIFPDFRVETNQGMSKVNVSLIHFDFKAGQHDLFSAYAILHIYDVRSDRKILMIDKTPSGAIPAKDKDGNTDFGLVKYGLLVEFLLGFDINLLKFARVNVSGIVSHEELNNSVFDNRPILYIPQYLIPGVGNVNFYDGNPLYREYHERNRTTLHPVFGLSLFDASQSMIVWSPGDKRVTAAESVLEYRIGDMAGTVFGKYNYYQYWGAEHGITLGMERIFGFLGFGAEYLARNNFFTDFYIELKPRFRGPQSLFQLSLSFNMARTPETIAIRRSAEFVPGGRVDLIIGYASSPYRENISGLNLHLYTVYNSYDTMKPFRGSVDTWGIGFGFGGRIEFQPQPAGSGKPQFGG